MRFFYVKIFSRHKNFDCLFDNWKVDFVCFKALAIQVEIYFFLARNFHIWSVFVDNFFAAVKTKQKQFYYFRKIRKRRLLGFRFDDHSSCFSIIKQGVFFYFLPCDKPWVWQKKERAKARKFFIFKGIQKSLANIIPYF